MKTLKIVFASSLVFFMLTSCNRDQTSIKKTAQTFLDAYYTQDYDIASQLASPTTQRLITQKQYFNSLNPSPQKPEKSEVIILGVQINDTAKSIVNYTYKGEKRQLLLSKMANKEWQVDMDASTPIEPHLGPSSLQSLPNENQQGVVSAESAPISLKDVK